MKFCSPIFQILFCHAQIEEVSGQCVSPFQSFLKGLLQIILQTDALSSLSDWLESAQHQFNWLRAPSWKHQFENQSQQFAHSKRSIFRLKVLSYRQATTVLVYGDID